MDRLERVFEKWMEEGTDTLFGAIVAMVQAEHQSVESLEGANALADRVADILDAVEGCDVPEAEMNALESVAKDLEEEIDGWE